jgi:hypothetical protein
MTFKTYQLLDGSFATTDAQAPDAYVAVWDVTDADAVEISRGAELLAADGALVIIPVPAEVVE